ncbi:putative hydrolase (plasmid) [Streptantibioticus cattleyicolor NRRL 8057 = DSM 46488]|nr:putative hydrolase [Streptantibioticus cattleyicolor NRRL 8057 = DSM 46488]
MLTNARVFDGHRVGEPSTVVIDGDRIGTDPFGGEVVDAAGAVLLPGLIDAHIHVSGEADLRELRASGVTTGLVMASWPPALVNSLRGRPGLPDLRTAGTPAIGPAGGHARMPGIPRDAVVTTPARARSFVAARVAEGADYIKVVAERGSPEGPDQPTLDALVDAAHRHGRLVVAHATTTGAYAMAIDAGADVLTHAPLDRALDAAAVSRLARDRRIVVPTLTMMEGVAERAGAGRDHRAARATVHALHHAGVPVLAGTDANSAPGAPAAVPHGTSLHHELELLVNAGLTPLDALRAATCLPARHFGLGDRGSVTPGLRADLLLIDGDPLADITATRAVRRVWCAGVEAGP